MINRIDPFYLASIPVFQKVEMKKDREIDRGD